MGIRQLPPDLVREIAAGEVVGAPADALKELLENALDASATRLDIAIDGGGINRLCVSDNGVGIARDELPLAAQQHNTSKLESLTNIRTFGFRGEGLYALRQAGKLKLTSRPQNQLGGASLYVQGEEMNLVEHPAAPGTSAELSDLFAELPARKRALEPESEELRKCTQLLSHYLLHHPSLALRLEVNRAERWNYAGGSYLEAVKFIWGPLTANRLLRLDSSEDTLTLNGLISRPELSRPRRDRLLLAVNGRPVVWEERWLKRVLLAYRELLPSGQYPVGILNLDLPPERVLVNTSPDKRSVRFLDEATVLDFVQDALEKTLAQHPLAAGLPGFSSVNERAASEKGVSSAPRSSFPQLVHVGTYRDLYLLAEADGDLWVVDQHAAHERIIFEELERRYLTDPPLELSHPELLTLSAEEAERYRSEEADLNEVGLVLEPFGETTWRIRSIPSFLGAHPDLVSEVVKGSLGPLGFKTAWRKILGRLACLPAIKAGHELRDVQAQHLLNVLASCHTPWACPHGRPTALVLSEHDLARKFGRSGVRSKTSKPHLKSAS